jgi:hypothetical protein
MKNVLSFIFDSFFSISGVTEYDFPASQTFFTNIENILRQKGLKLPDTALFRRAYYRENKNQKVPVLKVLIIGL